VDTLSTVFVWGAIVDLLRSNARVCVKLAILGERSDQHIHC